MSSLKDKVVFLTGASSGIGESLARELVAQGAKVALLARRRERLDGLCKEFNTRDTVALALEADVTRDEDLRRAAARTVEVWGRIDIVVANAGMGVMGNVDRMTLEDYHRQFDTNVWGVIRTVQATLGEVKKSRGSIAVVGSVAAFVPLPGGSAYGMSKVAVKSLCDTLRVELAPAGVQVLHIAPGFITTEIRTLDNHGKPGVKDPVPMWLQMPSQTAARKIARALSWRSSELILTGHGKFIVALSRLAPGLMNWTIAFATRRWGKKFGL